MRPDYGTSTELSDDSRRWEEDCLKAVLRALEQGYAKDMQAWDRTLKNVRLQGRAPETKLVVDFHDANHDRDVSWAFELWDKSCEAGLEGERDTPDGVAFLVFASVASPALPSDGR